MISPADPFLEAFAEAGADIITVHAEAGPHLDRSLQAIRALGCQAGVALNPATPAEAALAVLDRVDLVLVMTVNPGFGGQSFLDTRWTRSRRSGTASEAVRCGSKWMAGSLPTPRPAR